MNETLHDRWHINSFAIKKTVASLLRYLIIDWLMKCGRSSDFLDEVVFYIQNFLRLNNPLKYVILLEEKSATFFFVIFSLVLQPRQLSF